MSHVHSSFVPYWLFIPSLLEELEKAGNVPVLENVYSKMASFCTGFVASSVT